MSWELLCIMTIVIICTLAAIFRNTTFVKKYWGYLLILIPGAIVLIFKIVQDITDKKRNTTSQASANNTQEHIQEIKEQITEVQTVAKIEAAIAKTKNDTRMQELKKVQEIEDARERRKKLAAMIG